MKTLGLVLSLALHLSCAEPAPNAPTPPAPRSVAPEEADFDHAHARWTELLKAHVRGDRVDYAGLREQRAELQAYLDQLAAVSPAQLATWSEEQRFAFWINTYNAFCVQLVVDHYPVESIRDIGGKLFGRVWDKEYVPLDAHHPEGDDEPLSLNDLEHAILRVRFEDARLHAAINCASFSCPPLRAEAFVAERLDAQLEEQMRAFLADPARNRFDRAKGVASISAIFDWFGEDFERDAGNVRAYLARFVEDGAWLADAKVEHLDYDWALNDVADD